MASRALPLLLESQACGLQQTQRSPIAIQRGLHASRQDQLGVGMAKVHHRRHQLLRLVEHRRGAARPRSHLAIVPVEMLEESLAKLDRLATGA